ncbi:MAG: rod shape-determining protein MreD [Candidatus Marinimicrobia bacterium]|nr:rod shape-determining protein MreD [Candidatus Neomarinimicrobiota bacterium]
MERFARNFGIGLVVLLLQFTVGNWIILLGIKPDFVLLYVIYLGYKEGRVSGVIYGFSLGLLQDVAAASAFIGLSSLIKSIIGFGAGYLHGKYHILNPIWLSLIAIFLVLLGQVLYFGIYYSVSPLEFGEMMHKFILPTFAYTVAVGTVIFLTIPIPLDTT